jgi:hypothetical protein
MSASFIPIELVVSSAIRAAPLAEHLADPPVRG